MFPPKPEIRIGRRTDISSYKVDLLLKRVFNFFGGLWCDTNVHHDRRFGNITNSIELIALVTVTRDGQCRLIESPKTLQQ